MVEQIRVILYPRVSSKRQAESGDSIPAQSSRLTEFCRERKYEIVDQYTDAGKSASFDEESLKQELSNDDFINSFKLSKRPAFARLLREAKSDKFNAIVFYKWDRFARDIAFADLATTYFNKFGIKLIPSDDSEDPFMSSLMAVINKKEIEKMKERVKSIRLMRFENGIFTSRACYGYEPIIKDKKVIGFKPKTKEANIVRQCFQMTSEGFGYKEICSKFKLNPQSYYNIIKNPVYCGYIEFEGKTKKGIHESIISEELFNKVKSNRKT